MTAELFNQIYFRNSVLSWILFFGSIFVYFAGLRFLRWFLAERVFSDGRLTSMTGVQAVLALIRSTRSSFLLLAGLYFSGWHLDISDLARHRIDRIALLVLFIQFWKWGSLLVDFATEEYLRKSLAEDGARRTTLKAISVAARMVLFATLMIWVLDSLGVNITPLVAGLGVSGIAVTLALQAILGDMFASILIVLDKPFVIGDTIQVDNFQGTIESIGVKSTRLRSVNGEQIIFPNQNLLQSRVKNLRRIKERRSVVPLAVKYNTPPARLKKIGEIARIAVEREKDMRFERVNLVKLGDFSINYELIFWYLISAPDKNIDSNERILMSILEGFHQEKIEFAFPSQDIYVSKSVSELDPLSHT